MQTIHFDTLKIMVFIQGNNIGTKIWWEYKIVKYNTFMRKKVAVGIIIGVVKNCEVQQ